MGLPTERDAAHLSSVGQPERPGDLVQGQAIGEHVVVDEHALAADILGPGDLQGVAQWTFGDAAAFLVTVQHHRRSRPGLHDKGVPRDVEGHAAPGGISAAARSSTIRVWSKLRPSGPT